MAESVDHDAHLWRVRDSRAEAMLVEVAELELPMQPAVHQGPADQAFQPALYFVVGQDVCHVLRNHGKHEAFIGPAFLVQPITRPMSMSRAFSFSAYYRYGT
mgnify:CR=1 FL=1